MTDPSAAVDEPTLPPAHLRLPPPWATWALLVVIGAAFAAQLAVGHDPMSPKASDLLDAGGSLAPLSLGDEPWRLFTAMFLHGGILHLAMNALCLWSGGAFAERVLGRGPMLAIYLVAGLVGGIASARIHADAVSVGASGAIFGVFGAIGGYLVALRDRFDREAVAKQLRQLGTFFALNLVFGFTAAGIDVAAHLGGAVAGTALGWACGRWPTRRAAMLAGALATAVVLAFVVPPPAAPAYRAAFDEFDATFNPLIERVNALVTEAGSGTLGDAAFASRLELEILPAWQGARTRLADISPPARLVPLRAKMLRALDTRAAHWQALVELARGGAPDEARLRKLGDAADAAVRDLDTTVAELK